MTPFSWSPCAATSNVHISSWDNRSRQWTRQRDRSALLRAKLGFSVVAPTRVISPDSTWGRNASCAVRDVQKKLNFVKSDSQSLRQGFRSSAWVFDGLAFRVQTILRLEPRDNIILCLVPRDSRIDGRAMRHKNKWKRRVDSWHGSAKQMARTLPATRCVTCCALLKRWISSTNRRVLFCLNVLLLSASDTTFGRAMLSVEARAVSF